MPLTIESAGALVAGGKPEEKVMKTANIRVLRQFFLKHDVVAEVGSVHTVSVTFANELVAAKKAELTDAPPAPAPKKEVKPDPAAQAKKG
jgi:hypothetical protein